MEFKEIDMNKIMRNKKQPRESFDHERLMELAQSIKEGELLQPIVVKRVDDDKYGIVCGERRYRAFEYNKSKKIPCVIRKFTDDIDVLEKSAIENWHRENLTDVEKRNVINELWESGKYSSLNELSKKTGIGHATILNYVEDKEYRSRVTTPDNVSHTLVRETKGLTDDVRKKVIKTAVKEGISATEIREKIIPKLKEFDKPTVQKEELDRIVKRRKLTEDYEEREFEKDTDIYHGKREPDMEVRLESDPDKRKIERFKELWEMLITTAQKDYVKHMENEKLKKQAIKILWDIHNFTLKQLQGLGETKVIDHGKKNK